MIWIIASIPFWVIAAGCTALGVFGLLYGTFSKRITAGEELRNMVLGSVMLLSLGGIVAIVAAKICS